MTEAVTMPASIRDRVLSRVGGPTLAVGLAAIVSIVGVLFRQEGVPRYLTVWAEDGQIFGQCALNDPRPLHCLFTAYDGWIQTAPRLLAMVAAAFPIASYSYLVTLLAAGVTAVCAALVARAISVATQSWTAGFVAGASLAVVSMAAAEVGGNITNLPWILFTASAAILVAGLLGRRPASTDLGLVILSIASSPFGVFLTPLMALQSWVRRDTSRTAWFGLLASAALTVVQLLVATAGRKPIPFAPISVLKPVRWFLQLLREGPFGGHGIVPGWVVVAGVALFAASLAWLAIRTTSSVEAGGRASRLPAAWQPVVAITVLLSVVALEFATATYFNRIVEPRHQYAPAVGLVIALLIGAAALARMMAARRAGRILVPAVAGVVLLGFATTFRATTPASIGPQFPEALAAAAAACARGAAQAIVEISPAVSQGKTPWTMAVPCDRIEPAP